MERRRRITYHGCRVNNYTEKKKGGLPIMPGNAHIIGTINDMLKAIERDVAWARPSFNALRRSLGIQSRKETYARDMDWEMNEGFKVEVFTTAELDLKMRSLEAANPGHKAAFDIYRISLGIETQKQHAGFGVSQLAMLLIQIKASPEMTNELMKAIAQEQEIAR